ncbi:MAG: dTDP-4-dehydrorhamnose reductase [Acidobacteriaceae bacterium]
MLRVPQAQPRILVTGSTGQLGWECVRTLSALGEVYAPERDILDLTNEESIRTTVRTFRPQWIVNPAAYTAVDKAESEPELAYAINRDAVALIAEEARTLGAAVIHYSTDYVFDGTKPSPYVESDATNPVSVYGKSKLAGEQALGASGVPHFIFRTSWVYGARGRNFLLTILRLAQEREELRIVDDQHGAPTWCHDLARMTAEVVKSFEGKAAEQSCSAAQAATAYSGVYHACNRGETTWYGFASEALQCLHTMHPAWKLAKLIPITSAEYPTPAQRPANSRLDCSKLLHQLQIALPEWQLSLQQVLAAQPF